MIQKLLIAGSISLLTWLLLVDVDEAHAQANSTEADNPPDFTESDNPPDFTPGGGSHPGSVDSGVLFLGYGKVGGELGLRDVTRPVGGDGGGQCFEALVSPAIYWDDTLGGFVYPPPVLKPCHFEVFCYYHRLDDINEPSEIKDRWILARIASGEDALLVWRYQGVGDAEVVQLQFCYAETDGVRGDAILAGDADWGVTYTPEWSLVPLVDEVIDPVAEAEELWSLLEEPPIVVGGAPPVHERTVVQAETWVWVDQGAEPPWAVAVSPAQTAVLMVRANAVNTVWEFGDPDEVSRIECSMDQLVRFEVGVHQLMDPDAADACAYKYIHTCFNSSDPRFPRSQCGRDDGFDLTVTITFEGEQALMTRPSVSDGWPVPVWEPFSGSKDVTSEVLEVPVVEILSLNG